MKKLFRSGLSVLLALLSVFTLSGITAVAAPLSDTDVSDADVSPADISAADLPEISQQFGAVDVSKDTFKVIQVKGTNVNVRPAASTSGTALGQVSSPMAYAVMGTTTAGGYTWYQISYRSGSSSKAGYIRGDYATLFTTAQYSTAFVCTSEAVVIRDKAGAAGKQTGSAYMGEVYTIQATTHVNDSIGNFDWYKVSRGSVTGYICAGNVRRLTGFTDGTSTTPPTVTVAPPTAVPQAAKTELGADLIRLSGNDRYDTAIAICNQIYETSDNVVLASGLNFADALSGAPLAYMLDAPILLTKGGTALETTVLNQIGKLKAKTVYILGGIGAINDGIKTQLEGKGYTVKRLAGADRYATAVEVAKEMDSKRGRAIDTFVVADGRNFPDALSIAPVAAINGWPILFTPGNTTGFNSVSETYFRSKGMTKAAVIGGPGVITASAETRLTACGVTVDRTYGDDRYWTSAAIATKYKSVFTGDGAAVATGLNFPDALTGSIFAAKKKIPLVLLNGNGVRSDYAKNALLNTGAKKVYSFGGTNVLSDNTIAMHIGNPVSVTDPNRPDQGAVATIAISTDNSPVRDAMTIEAGVVTRLAKNTEFAVLEVISNGIWYKVKIGGTVCYVYGADATLTLAATLPEKAKGYSSYNNISLNQSAASNSSSLATLSKGDALSVLAVAYDSGGNLWYKVKSGDKTGYVIGASVSFEAPDNIEPGGAGSPKAGDTVYIKSLIAPLRNGAGQTFSKLTGLARGTEAVILAVTKDAAGNTWYQVEAGGMLGYILLSNISTTPVTKNEYPLYLSAAFAFLNEYPGQEGANPLLIKKSTAMTCIGYAGNFSGTDWYAVKVGNQAGYVMGSKVSSMVIQPDTLPGSVLYVKAGATIVRTEPETNGATVATVVKGASYPVFASTLSSSGAVWYAIEINNRAGYILSGDVSFDPNDASTGGGTLGTRTVKTGTVNATSINVRSGAGTSYSSLGYLANGTKVTIVETVTGTTVSGNNQWYKIEYRSSSTGYGYVSAYYIKDVKQEVQAVNLKFGQDFYYVDVGKTLNLSINISEIPGIVITYSSASTANAPISAAGVVTGKTAGLYRITATCSGITATTEVAVLAPKLTGGSSLKISESGLQFVATWEGGASASDGNFRPYKDATGNWTLGYGHAMLSAEAAAIPNTAEGMQQIIPLFNVDIAALIGPQYVMTAEKPYLTPAEARMLLGADMEKRGYQSAIRDWAVRNGVYLTQQQFDALVSFAYNRGPNYWNRDTDMFYLKSAIICYRDGRLTKPNQIMEGFTYFISSQGKNLKGLWYRRCYEASLFSTGVYPSGRSDDSKYPPPTSIVWN